MTSIPFPLTALLVLSTILAGPISTAAADEFHLVDGAVVAGVFIGQAEGTTYYLDADGKRQEMTNDSLHHIDRRHRLDDNELEQKGAQLRQQFLEDRQRQFDKLFKRVAAGSTAADKLTGFSEEEMLPALVRALCRGSEDSGKHRKRWEVAAHSLASCKSPDSILAHAIVAVAAPSEEIREQSHTSAWQSHEELTLAFYEYVAQLPTLPGLRTMALQRIGAAGKKSSGGSLIGVLRGLRLETGATLAKQLPSRFRPLNLGNTQLTVELPVVEVFHVAGAVQTFALNTVGRHATLALQQISGYSYGNDLTAWQRWWERTQKELATPSSGDHRKR